MSRMIPSHPYMILHNIRNDIMCIKKVKGDYKTVITFSILVPREPLIRIAVSVIGLASSQSASF